MITLNLLKLLELNGFGKIDEDLLWEKLALGKDGVYILSLGDSTDRGARRSCRYELYSRNKKSDVAGRKKLEEIVKFLNNSFAQCTLPEVTNSNGAVIAPEAKNVTIMPLSTIANNGLDANNRIIWSANGQIYY